MFRIACSTFAVVFLIPAVGLAFSDHLFVVTSNGSNAGNCAALELQAPWTAEIGLEPVGVHPAVRHFGGVHYVVNGSPSDDVRIIDPETFDTVRTIPFEAGSNPQDIVVVAGGTAFVSFFDLDELRRVDLASGAIVARIDLGAFADADGFPEAGRMIRDGNHLLVQLQRIDRSPEAAPQARSLLAVVNIPTNQLVDADPQAPGIQAIELSGWIPIPGIAMQLEGRRLYLSEPGGFYNQEGGIEAVDLDTLQALGYVYTEKQIGAAQMSAFLLVSPERGYFVNHTDFAQSSHLVSFSRTTGTFLAEHFVSFGLVERLAHDRSTDLVYFPDNDPSRNGVRVFDAATGAQLTSSPISTGLPPADLVIARDGASDSPPISTGLRVWAAPNPTRGPARIFWESPAAATARLAIVDARGRTIRAWSASMIGRGDMAWDGRDGAGVPVAGGVYFLHAMVEGRLGVATSTTKLGVLRR